MVVLKKIIKTEKFFQSKHLVIHSSILSINPVLSLFLFSGLEGRMGLIAWLWGLFVFVWFYM